MCHLNIFLPCITCIGACRFGSKFDDNIFCVPATLDLLSRSTHDDTSTGSLLHMFMAILTSLSINFGN
jgi:hypothetical protein